MLERLVIIAIGTVFFYLVRFKIIRKPYSPLKSGIVATLIMVAGIQYHYHYLPYETFQGGSPIPPSPLLPSLSSSTAIVREKLSTIRAEIKSSFFSLFFRTGKFRQAQQGFPHHGSLLPVRKGGDPVPCPEDRIPTGKNLLS